MMASSAIDPPEARGMKRKAEVRKLPEMGSKLNHLWFTQDAFMTVIKKELKRRDDEITRLRLVLEHIATYPQLRRDELGYAAARKIAWAALQAPTFEMSTL